jgi:predicted RNA binding protein YcfA (HicA-like mRNA interferase family)
MTCYKSRKVISALLKKGFAATPGDHHFLVYYYNGEKTAVYTMVSHGANHDIGDNLISKMKEQLQISKEDFQRLVDCTLSGDGLRGIYEQKGICKPNRLS